MKRMLFLLAASLMAVSRVSAQKVETLTSPSGNIRLEVTVGERLTMSAFRGSEQILKDCALSLQVGKDAFGTNPRLSGKKRTKVFIGIRSTKTVHAAYRPRARCN